MRVATEGDATDVGSPIEDPGDPEVRRGQSVVRTHSEADQESETAQAEAVESCGLTDWRHVSMYVCCMSSDIIVGHMRICLLMTNE